MSAIGRVLEKHKEGRILSMGGRCWSEDIPKCLTDGHFPDCMPSTACLENAVRKWHVYIFCH
jgi:hypothetical protein